MKLFLSMEYQCQLFHIEMRDSHRNFSKRLGIFGTKPNLSIEYHPQTDGQSERMIQIIEDMLRACSLNFKRSWDDHLPLVEFAYNNSYHSSIGIAPFEALYGRNCRSPLCQDEVGEKKKRFQRLKQFNTLNNQLKRYKRDLQTAQDRQKKYADLERMEKTFEIGEKVLSEVSLWKEIIRFGKRNNLISQIYRTI